MQRKTELRATAGWVGGWGAVLPPAAEGLPPDPPNSTIKSGTPSPGLTRQRDAVRSLVSSRARRVRGHGELVVIRCTKSSFQNRLFRPKFSTLSFSSFLSLSLPHTSNLRSGLPSVTLETLGARCLVFRMSYLVSKVRYMRRQISDLTQICFSLVVVMCV